MSRPGSISGRRLLLRDPHPDPPDLDHEPRNKKRYDAGRIVETGRNDRNDDPEPPHQHPVAVTHTHHAQGIILVLHIYDALDCQRHEKEIGNCDRPAAESSQNHTVIKFYSGFRKDQMQDQEQSHDADASNPRAHSDGDCLLLYSFL